MQLGASEPWVAAINYEANSMFSAAGCQSAIRHQTICQIVGEHRSLIFECFSRRITPGFLSCFVSKCPTHLHGFCCWPHRRQIRASMTILFKQQNLSKWHKRIRWLHWHSPYPALHPTNPSTLPRHNGKVLVTRPGWPIEHRCTQPLVHGVEWHTQRAVCRRSAFHMVSNM